ncbi:hypothetical protein ACO1MB_14555, partial [Staphylococcus aureus]
AATPTDTPSDVGTGDVAAGTQPGASGSVITIQVDTPSAGSVTATESALQVVPGVRSAVTTSLAIGGVSVMRVGFDADPA